MFGEPKGQSPSWSYRWVKFTIQQSVLAFVLFVKSWRKRKPWTGPHVQFTHELLKNQKSNKWAQQAGEYEPVSERVRFLIRQRLVRIKIPYKVHFPWAVRILTGVGILAIPPKIPTSYFSLATSSSRWLESAGEHVVWCTFNQKLDYIIKLSFVLILKKIQFCFVSLSSFTLLFSRTIGFTIDFKTIACYRLLSIPINCYRFC